MCLILYCVSWITDKGGNLCNVIFWNIWFAWTHLCPRHGENLAGRKYWHHHLPKSHFTLQINVVLGHELPSLWVTSSPLSAFSLSSLFCVPYFGSQIRPDHLARMESRSWHWTRFYWTCNFKAGTTDSFLFSCASQSFVWPEKLSWSRHFGPLWGAGLKGGL